MSRRDRKPARRLSLETLEGRRLLVSGVPVEFAPQNFANPEDTNYDGLVSPSDALTVINALNAPHQSQSQKSFSTDVDGDGVVSPRDALLVINRLNSRSDTSAVPPQQRAIGLRRALNAGFIPPKMSLSEAQEMLETLENGGRYETGERYRNGKMFNVHQQPQDLGSSASGVASEDGAPTAQTFDSTSDKALPEMTSPQSVEQRDDPLALFDSANETLSGTLHDPTLWQAVLDATDPSGAEADDRFSLEIAERLAERLGVEDAREQMAQSIANYVQSGDKTVEDIITELAAVRATLGDANSQIAHLFANLDVEGIIERIGVDLGSLAEALVSNNHPELVEFLSREYLPGLDEILP